MVCRLLLLVMLGVLCAADAGGADSASAANLFTDAEWQAHGAAAPGVPVAAPPALGPSLATLSAGVLAVTALALGLGWMARRLGARRLVLGRGRHVEVIEVVSIAPKRQVALLRIADQVVLVGLGDHELAHLATLPALAVLGSASVAVASASTPASAFAQIMTRLGGRGPA